MGKLTVLGTEISYYQHDESDYICLTDMVKNLENGLALIEKWLRNKNTIEFLGIWKKCTTRGSIPPNSRELEIKPGSTGLFFL